MHEHPNVFQQTGQEIQKNKTNLLKADFLWERPLIKSGWLSELVSERLF